MMKLVMGLMPIMQLSKLVTTYLRTIGSYKILGVKDMENKGISESKWEVIFVKPKQIVILLVWHHCGKIRKTGNENVHAKM